MSRVDTTSLYYNKRGSIRSFLELKFQYFIIIPWGFSLVANENLKLKSIRKIKWWNGEDSWKSMFMIFSLLLMLISTYLSRFEEFLLTSSIDAPYFEFRRIDTKEIFEFVSLEFVPDYYQTTKLNRFHISFIKYIDSCKNQKF